MYIFTDTQRFKCFGCQISGDLVDFEEVAGRHIETWTAALALADRYGVKLPRRPGRWHKRQSEKQRQREMVRDTLTAAYQRRFFRVYGGYLADIADPAEREAEARRFYDDLRTLAETAAENRMSR
jgi:DNA primase